MDVPDPPGTDEALAAALRERYNERLRRGIDSVRRAVEDASQRDSRVMEAMKADPDTARFVIERNQEIMETALTHEKEEEIVGLLQQLAHRDVDLKHASSVEKELRLEICTLRAEHTALEAEDGKRVEMHALVLQGEVSLKRELELVRGKLVSQSDQFREREVKLRRDLEEQCKKDVEYVRAGAADELERVHARHVEAINRLSDEQAHTLASMESGHGRELKRIEKDRITEREAGETHGLAGEVKRLEGMLQRSEERVSEARAAIAAQRNQFDKALLADREASEEAHVKALALEVEMARAQRAEGTLRADRDGLRIKYVAVGKRCEELSVKLLKQREAYANVHRDVAGAAHEKLRTWKVRHAEKVKHAVAVAEQAKHDQAAELLGHSAALGELRTELAHAQDAAARASAADARYEELATRYAETLASAAQRDATHAKLQVELRRSVVSAKEKEGRHAAALTLVEEKAKMQVALAAATHENHFLNRELELGPHPAQHIVGRPAYSKRRDDASVFDSASSVASEHEERNGSVSSAAPPSSDDAEGRSVPGRARASNAGKGRATKQSRRSGARHRRSSDSELRASSASQSRTFRRSNALRPSAVETPGGSAAPFGSTAWAGAGRATTRMREAERVADEAAASVAQMRRKAKRDEKRHQQELAEAARVKTTLKERVAFLEEKVSHHRDVAELSGAEVQRLAALVEAETKAHAEASAMATAEAKAHERVHRESVATLGAVDEACTAQLVAATAAMRAQIIARGECIAHQRHGDRLDAVGMACEAQLDAAAAAMRAQAAAAAAIAERHCREVEAECAARDYAHAELSGELAAHRDEWSSREAEHTRAHALFERAQQRSRAELAAHSERIAVHRRRIAAHGDGHVAMHAAVQRLRGDVAALRRDATAQMRAIGTAMVDDVARIGARLPSLLRDAAAKKAALVRESERALAAHEREVVASAMAAEARETAKALEAQAQLRVSALEAEARESASAAHSRSNEVASIAEVQERELNAQHRAALDAAAELHREQAVEQAAVHAAALEAAAARHAAALAAAAEHEAALLDARAEVVGARETHAAHTRRSSVAQDDLSASLAAARESLATAHAGHAAAQLTQREEHAAQFAAQRSLARTLAADVRSMRADVERWLRSSSRDIGATTTSIASKTVAAVLEREHMHSEAVAAHAQLRARFDALQVHADKLELDALRIPQLAARNAGLRRRLDAAAVLLAGLLQSVAPGAVLPADALSVITGERAVESDALPSRGGAASLPHLFRSLAERLSTFGGRPCGEAPSGVLRADRVCREFAAALAELQGAKALALEDGLMQRRVREFESLHEQALIAAAGAHDARDPHADLAHLADSAIPPAGAARVTTYDERAQVLRIRAPRFIAPSPRTAAPSSIVVRLESHWHHQLELASRRRELASAARGAAHDSASALAQDRLVALERERRARTRQIIAAAERVDIYATHHRATGVAETAELDASEEQRVVVDLADLRAAHRVRQSSRERLRTIMSAMSGLASDIQKTIATTGSAAAGEEERARAVRKRSEAAREAEQLATRRLNELRALIGAQAKGRARAYDTAFERFAEGLDERNRAAAKRTAQKVVSDWQAEVGCFERTAPPSRSARGPLRELQRDRLHAEESVALRGDYDDASNADGLRGLVDSAAAPRSLDDLIAQSVAVRAFDAGRQAERPSGWQSGRQSGRGDDHADDALFVDEEGGRGGMVETSKSICAVLHAMRLKADHVHSVVEELGGEDDAPLLTLMDGPGLALGGGGGDGGDSDGVGFADSFDGEGGAPIAIATDSEIEHCVAAIREEIVMAVEVQVRRLTAAASPLAPAFAAALKCLGAVLTLLLPLTCSVSFHPPCPLSLSPLSPLSPPPRTQHTPHNTGAATPRPVGGGARRGELGDGPPQTAARAAAAAPS